MTKFSQQMLILRSITKLITRTRDPTWWSVKNVTSKLRRLHLTDTEVTDIAKIIFPKFVIVVAEILKPGK